MVALVAPDELLGGGLFRWEPTLKILTVLSSDPDTKKRESGLKATVFTQAPCDLITVDGKFSAGLLFQIRTVLSMDAVAMRWPEGLNAT